MLNTLFCKREIIFFSLKLDFLFPIFFLNVLALFSVFTLLSVEGTAIPIFPQCNRINLSLFRGRQTQESRGQAKDKGQRRGQAKCGWIGKEINFHLPQGQPLKPKLKLKFVRQHEQLKRGPELLT